MLLLLYHGSGSGIRRMINNDSQTDKVSEIC